MRRSSPTLAACLTLGLAAAFTPARGLADDLKVGDKAPNFALKGSDGKTYDLADFRGKSAVVLAWFPKAFTGGCTIECKSLRENGEAIRKFDVIYFTASTDDAETNKKFSESLGLDYPILSDPTQETARVYGVVHEGRKVPERWTFYIDKEGVIRAIDKSVQPKNAAADVAAKLKELGVAAR